MTSNERLVFLESSGQLLFETQFQSARSMGFLLEFGPHRSVTPVSLTGSPHRFELSNHFTVSLARPNALGHFCACCDDLALDHKRGAEK